MPIRGAQVNLDPAIALIKEFEGCALVSYQDSGGLWTIGYGHIDGVTPGMVITAEQAERFFEQDLANTAKLVLREVKNTVSNNQLCALVSFTFNEGVGHLEESTTLKEINAGDYEAAASALLLWDKCRGSVVAGLLRRRKAERDLFLSV